MALSYCQAVASGDLHPVHALYHDTEYGFPITQDDRLFERLVLEINQAGLSWEIILKRKDGFVRAYDQFAIEVVAGYGETEVARLLADPGIIRNRAKVAAAIENARRIRGLQEQHGSFRAWLDTHHPQSKPEWVARFKKTFVFTGGEIVGEFLMSTGYLPGAHEESCPTFAVVAAQNPPWLRP